MRRPVLAAALLISLSACQGLPFIQQAAEPPKPTPAPAARLPDFEPVVGRWQVGKAANLRAGPSTDFPVVGGIKAGQPLDVLGKVPGAEWFAVKMGDRHAYIHTRLVHQMDEPPPVTATTVVAVPAPIRQAEVMQVPPAKAPPRTVQSSPLAAPVPIAASAPAPVPATAPPVVAPASPIAAPVSIPVPAAASQPAVPAARLDGGWVATGAPVSFKPIAR
ncbi:hypothetical protein GGE65_005258 [Skermanella aerolata]|uniref:SH3 domain-containing protein n=1 Tax=Skermanella aerolata TaxID=393310 RepID=UPI003D1DECA1